MQVFEQFVVVNATPRLYSGDKKQHAGAAWRHEPTPIARKISTEKMKMAAKHKNVAEFTPVFYPADGNDIACPSMPGERASSMSVFTLAFTGRNEKMSLRSSA
jgi:hypothetical protein